MNLTDLSVTPLHAAFDEVCARRRGPGHPGDRLRAGRPGAAPAPCSTPGGIILRKQQRSLGVSEAELIQIAIKSMGLDELGAVQAGGADHRVPAPRSGQAAAWSDRTVGGLRRETAASRWRPGAARWPRWSGALGAALGTMVANLSSHKRGWDDRWEEFSDWAVRGQTLKDELLAAGRRGHRAFNRVMAALGMPRSTDPERGGPEPGARGGQPGRDRGALAGDAARPGRPSRCSRPWPGTAIPASASDAGVGALAARAAVLGAWLNVRTNLPGLADRARADTMLAEGARMELEAAEEREEDPRRRGGQSE